MPLAMAESSLVIRVEFMKYLDWETCCVTSDAIALRFLETWQGCVRRDTSRMPVDSEVASQTAALCPFLIC